MAPELGKSTRDLEMTPKFGCVGLKEMGFLESLALGMPSSMSLKDRRALTSMLWTWGGTWGPSGPTSVVELGQQKQEQRWL